MKKIVAVIVMILMLAPLCACGDEGRSIHEEDFLEAYHHTSDGYVLTKEFGREFYEDIKRTYGEDVASYVMDSLEDSSYTMKELFGDYVEYLEKQ